MDVSVDMDIWRDSPLRYMGYANELGESFRLVVPRFLLPSYVIAFAHVVADTLHKGKNANELANARNLRHDHKLAVVSEAVVDALLWQTLVRTKACFLQKL